LSGSVDPDHTHNGFNHMCDPDPVTYKCRNDGAWQTTYQANAAYAYVENSAVTNSDGSRGHLLDPYLTLATSYGWANFMFQTNQGPSYPAHQFLFSGTSARTAQEDADSRFVSENFDKTVYSVQAGCLARPGESNQILSPNFSTPAAGCNPYLNGSVVECTVANNALIFPTNPVGEFCVDHPAMSDLLESRSISWKYYAPLPGSIWTAPDAIKRICQPAWVDPNSGGEYKGLQCTGAEWNAHVDIGNLGTDILRDIAACSLPQVSWVIPNGTWSDHASENDQYGPSWVAAIVNAIGNRPKCPAGTAGAGETYWQDTAIVITWDDWGGWSDHRPPPQASTLPCHSFHCQGDYQYGFRVPLLVVSAYTPAGYIDNDEHDFGSILRMIEGIEKLPEGALGFADQRSTTNLHQFFSLSKPRQFSTIPAEKDASFFLNQTGAAVDPDDD
jgi:phospholipase C